MPQDLLRNRRAGNSFSPRVTARPIVGPVFMKKIGFLRARCDPMCGLIAFVLAAIVSLHVAMTEQLPIADGQGYAMRAFALFGFLHRGQWVEFLRLLTYPAQSVLAPHDVVFFLLPRVIANAATYVFVLYATTYALLAVGVVTIARQLSRPEWAPVILLFCGINNVALTDFYAYYIDMEFMAAALLGLALQIRAWNEKRAAASLLAGALVGGLFFFKPANALIYLFIYILTELFHMGSARGSGSSRLFRKDLFYKLGGFILPVALAFLCGAGQSILLLIDQNEVNRTVANIESGGLLRLFYFPLCLSVFYHMILLGILLITAFFAGKEKTRQADAPTPFPAHLVVPCAIAYLIFGQFFSFWMLAKPMRALLILLPLLWIAVCWFWEKRRLRIESLFFVATIYTCAAFAQKEFNLMRARDQLVEDNYQLDWQSWVEMPSPWRHGTSLNREICDWIIRDLPPTGILCVNAIEIRNSLDWRLGQGPLLDGKARPYKIRNLFDYKGEYFDQALPGAKEIMLVTFSPVQSSRAAWLRSMALVSYGDETWCGANPLARHLSMRVIQGETIGHAFIFHQPLTVEQVEAMNRSSPFATVPGAPGDGMEDALYGRHFTSREAGLLLRAWYEKRRIW